MKPILFNTEMVRAILEGRKTVTRRVVNPANPFRNHGYYQGNGLWIDGYGKGDEPNGHIKDYSVSSCWLSKKHYIENHAPYKVNDILYVRETWIPKESEENGKLVKGFAYKADFTGYESMFAWRPSIHMPKEAARIFLKVTDVRVERLQDMTRDDMLKEGIVDHCGNCKAPFGCDLCMNESAVEDEFFHLWNDTIKKDQLNNYGWYANPYVWVIEFERVEKPAAD